MYRSTLIGLFVLPGLLAHSETASSPRNAQQFERDRAAILGMAGDFRVTFRFDETLTLDPESSPSKRHLSRGHETVSVLEDRGDFISLQHLLVVEDGEGHQHVVKHWRQDWAYQAASMLVYTGDRTWKSLSVRPAKRKNAWTQTVYQVDDSPRYAGVGTWEHIGEYAMWESNETWRPLPRREEKERDDYDVLVGTNRHSLTPDGWAHEQDNYKLALDESGNRVLARETGFNTYRRVDDYDFTAAHRYFEATAEFWSAVRDRWHALKQQADTLHITDEIDGEKLYQKVMPIAQGVASGEYASLGDALAAYDEVRARYLSSPAQSTD